MIKFGTGGWRAVIAEGFTFENVRRVAQGLSNMIIDDDAQQRVIVAHDLRFLSGRFSRAFAEVLTANGIEALFIEEAVPTPMVMYGVLSEGLDYGITVTASHNPPEYNGIKLFVKEGKDAPQEVTDRLERYIAEISYEPVEHGEFFSLIREGKIKYYTNKNSYINFLLEQVDVETISEKNLQILFNPMYGVSRDIMMICLASMRCSVDTINDYRDTMFGTQMPSPIQSSLQDMEYQIKNEDYHLGIATDGDSDRLGLYDDRGEFVDANEILILLYYYFLEYRGEKGGVVRNLTTTHILDRIAEAYGEKHFEVPVGFKNISAKMEEEDLLFGGESSGGLKLKGKINGKDGIQAALFSVEMLAKTGKTLSELLDEIHNRFGYLKFHGINIPYQKEDKRHLYNLLFREKYIPNFEELAAAEIIKSDLEKEIKKGLNKSQQAELDAELAKLDLGKMYLKKELKEVSYLDGVKFYFEDGTWLSIRFSGTEPLIRIFMEMNNQAEIDAVIKLIKEDEKLKLDGEL
jgi:phosphomannomutase